MFWVMNVIRWHWDARPRQRIEIKIKMVIDVLVGWFGAFAGRKSFAISAFLQITKLLKWILWVGRCNDCGCSARPLPFDFDSLKQSPVLWNWFVWDNYGMDVQMPEIIPLLALMLDHSEHFDFCTLKIIRTKFFPNLSEMFDVCILWIEVSVIPNIW